MIYVITTKTHTCIVYLLVNGGWAAWEAWAIGCSVAAGASTTQTRYRKCTNPTPSGGGAQCSGDNGQTLTCSGTF